MVSFAAAFDDPGGYLERTGSHKEHQKTGGFGTHGDLLELLGAMVAWMVRL